MGISDEVSLGVNMLPMSFPGQAHGHSPAFKAPDDLPKTVARTLTQGSSPMSMDFHPIKQTLLLGMFLAQIFELPCTNNFSDVLNSTASMYQLAQM